MDELQELAGKDDRRLLFVVGMWRSGTSLIHALLNGHSQIALMYEAEPMDLWPHGTGFVAGGDWPHRLEFFNQALSRHRLRIEDFAETLPGHEAALTMYQAYARASGACVMGEKAPAYFSRLRRLGREFPQARFLIIWRNPLDCCRSALKAGRKDRFFAQRGMMTRLLLGAQALAGQVDGLRRDGHQVHELVFDELLANTPAELCGVCDFLGVAFEPGMVDLKSADLSALPPGEHHHLLRAGVIAPVTCGNDATLSANFVAKAHRYANLWRGRFAHLGFSRTLCAGPDGAKPGILEQLSDRCAYGGWRALDAFKRSLFRRIPLRWWASLRRATPRGQAPADSTWAANGAG